MTRPAVDRPFVFHPTPEPGVFNAKRSGGGWHVIESVGAPFVRCTTCEAAKNSIDCWAVLHAARYSKELIEEAKMASTSENTTALAIAQRGRGVLKATETRLEVAAHLEAWTDLVSLGAAHLATGLAPKGLDRPEKCALVLLKAMELGVPLTTAYEFFYIVGGRVGVMGQMVRALVEAKLGGDGYIHVEESTATRAVCVGYRKGRQPVRVVWTIEDAQRAGLMGNETWKKFPADHLVAKASARCGRRLFADVLGGMVVTDHGSIVDSMDVEDDAGHAIGGTETVIEGEFIVHSEPAARGGETEVSGNPPAAAEEPLDAEFTDTKPIRQSSPHDVTNSAPAASDEETLFQEFLDALNANHATPGALSMPMKSDIGTGQWCPENALAWVEKTGKSPTDLVLGALALRKAS